jgi:hypothetical protein
MTVNVWNPNVAPQCGGGSMLFVPSRGGPT